MQSQARLSYAEAPPSIGHVNSNLCASRMQSQARLSYAEAPPSIGHVNSNLCASRMQSQACLSYAVAPPSIGYVNSNLNQPTIEKNCFDFIALWQVSHGEAENPTIFIIMGIPLKQQKNTKLYFL